MILILNKINFNSYVKLCSVILDSFTQRRLVSNLLSVDKYRMLKMIFPKDMVIRCSSLLLFFKFISLNVGNAYKNFMKINVTMISFWHNSIAQEQKVTDKYLENVLPFTDTSEIW